MSALINFSINLEKLSKQKFVKGKSGVWVNLTMSVNDETNSFGQNTAIFYSQSKLFLQGFIEKGIKVNHQPTIFSSVGVGEEFTKIHAVGKKVIVPRSGASTPFLKELLNKIGIDVLEIHLYDVCAFRDTTQWNGFRELFSQNKIDGVVFTSASSVRGFFEIMSKDYEMDSLIDNLVKLSV